jgi:hypothetical protein
MISAFSRFRGDIEDDLEAQVARLSKDVAALKKMLSRRGSDVYQEAGDAAADLYSEMRHRFADALPAMRAQARIAERAARDHPATAAIAGLALVGLLVVLLSRK